MSRGNHSISPNTDKKQDNIEIQEKETSLSPEPTVEKAPEGTRKPGKLRKLRKRISRLFGCRKKQCSSDFADEPEFPQEDVEEAVTPVPSQEEEDIEIIKLDDSQRWMEDEQELFRPLTTAPFRRQCWMENVDPAWNLLDYSTDIASIPVCYKEDDYIEVISLDDTESEEIEIEVLRPTTPASFRRHRWMENEDPAWNLLVSSNNIASILVFYEEDDDIEVIVLDDKEWIKKEKIRPAFRRQCWIENEDPAWNPLVCSNNIEFTPVVYLEDDETEVISLDDIEREWIEEDIIRPITPDYSRRSCSIENEDLAWETPRCSSKITPVPYGSQENDEVVLFKLNDSQRKWIEEEHERIRMIAPASFIQNNSNEHEVPAQNDSDSNRNEILFSVFAPEADENKEERAEFYSVNRDRNEEEKMENVERIDSERIALTPPGLLSFAHPENQRNTRFDTTIQRIDTALNHTRLVCGTPPSIDDFNIQSLLGEGSYGKVYKANYSKTGRAVAIKTIESFYMDKPTAFASVLREQRILLLAKKENCHFLTRLFASFSTEHYICLAMEFVEGGDLASHLVRNGMSQERTRFYSACIVLGLQFLHDRNITHRDLKLENVLLDRDGYAKITDFGISKEGMSFTDRSQTQCGTLPYMAPEMFTQYPFTRSVDWWGLGVCIYLMRLSQIPFTGDDAEEIIHNIVYEEPRYPPSLTPEIYNIITQLLTKTPYRRLGSDMNGAEDVKKSDFFEGLDWEALQKKEVQPPFVPKIKVPEICTEVTRFTRAAIRGGQGVQVSGNRVSFSLGIHNYNKQAGAILWTLLLRQALHHPRILFVHQNGGPDVHPHVLATQLNGEENRGIWGEQSNLVSAEWKVKVIVRGRQYLIHS